MKMSQIDTENDKKPQIFQLSKFFLAFFVTISTDFVDWNISKGQQGKGWSSGSLL